MTDDPDDLIFDQDGYPTHAVLEAIRTWQPAVWPPVRPPARALALGELLRARQPVIPR